MRRGNSHKNQGASTPNACASCLIQRGPDKGTHVTYPTWQVAFGESRASDLRPHLNNATSQLCTPGAFADLQVATIWDNLSEGQSNTSRRTGHCMAERRLAQGA